MKEKSAKKKGDDGEKFVFFVLKAMGYISEMHPRTFRPVFLKGGMQVMVSQDNDYHNAFDLKAERYDHMIYAQVKWMSSGETVRNDIKEARENIEKKYPYFFPYQRLQVWMVWREWVKRANERRHKEWRFRVWQRGKPEEINERGIHFFKWDWKEVTEEVRKEYESYQDLPKLKFDKTTECNNTMSKKEAPQIVSKSAVNKNKGGKR